MYMLPFQTAEAQAIFLNPFTVCSSCKQKTEVIICPFVAKKQMEVIFLQTDQIDLPIYGKRKHYFDT